MDWNHHSLHSPPKVTHTIYTSHEGIVRNCRSWQPFAFLATCLSVFCPTVVKSEKIGARLVAIWHKWIHHLGTAKCNGSKTASERFQEQTQARKPCLNLNISGCAFREKKKKSFDCKLNWWVAPIWFGTYVQEEHISFWAIMWSDLSTSMTLSLISILCCLDNFPHDWVISYWL